MLSPLHEALEGLAATVPCRYPRAMQGHGTTMWISAHEAHQLKAHTSLNQHTHSEQQTAQNIWSGSFYLDGIRCPSVTRLQLPTSGWVHTLPLTPSENCQPAIPGA